MSDQNKSVALTGSVHAVGDKFNAKITLETPDGQVSSIESGPIYGTEAEARDMLAYNIDRLLKDFEKRGLSIKSFNTGMIN